MKTLFALLAAALTCLPALAGSIEGNWEKSDKDATIRVWVNSDGKLCGVITSVKDPKRTHDTNNPDASLRSRKLVGLQIVSGFWKDGDTWVGGTVYDSKSGKTYKGKIWLVGEDKLMMRGFVGVSLIGRTAEWSRVK